MRREVSAPVSTNLSSTDAPAFAHLLQQQLDILQKQLQLLVPTGELPHVASPVVNEGKKGIIESEKMPALPVMIQRHNIAMPALTPEQEEHLQALVADLNEKTPTSKKIAHVYRKLIAQPVQSSTLPLAWQPLFYPLTGKQAKGAMLWDMDENEYIDLSADGGTNLLGHSPDTILKGIQWQLARSSERSTHPALTGEVGKLFNDHIQVERLAFCATEEEAEVVAYRLAQAVTQRRAIAYVGQAPPSVLDYTYALVLSYGTPEALAQIESASEQLAAVVLVANVFKVDDPFVQQLHALTETHGIALIIDERQHGLRFHQGGAQAVWGITADMLLHGNAIANGMPLGIIAGKKRWLDSIDGGGQS